MGIASTYEIHSRLQEIFGDKGRPTRQDTLRSVINTKMIEGTPIRDHMIRLIALFNEMEILGAEIDRESMVDMILDTLQNSFKQFKLNYSMNKLKMSLPKLMKEIQMAKGLLKDLSVFT